MGTEGENTSVGGTVDIHSQFLTFFRRPRTNSIVHYNFSIIKISTVNITKRNVLMWDSPLYAVNILSLVSKEAALTYDRAEYSWVGNLNRMQGEIKQSLVDMM